MRNVLITLLLIAIPASALALTPIARTDVVPYQYIAYGSSFDFGVKASSKTGIDRVEFTISGPGYTGDTKVAAMRLSTRLAITESAVPIASRPGAWEYYVTISSSDFTSDGEVIVSPTVYGIDGGVRVLESVPLIVKATASDSHVEAWEGSARGLDSEKAVDNVSLPLPSIDATVGAGQDDSVGGSNGSGGGSGCFIDTAH